MDLAPALARFLPELRELDTDEPLAPCAHCVMAPVSGEAEVGGGRVRFTAPARCCTYHPQLANVLAGAALREGGPGAAAIHARLSTLDGVDSLGIGPPAAAARRYAQRSAEAFGRDASLTCPFWVRGPLGCSIHPHRNAICRTWSCRRTHGERGARAAEAIKHLVYDLEARIAAAAAQAMARHLPTEQATGADWARYFVACADWCDGLDDDAFHGPRRDALLAQVTRAVARRDRPLPSCPTPALRAWTHHADRVELQSWSPYDPVDAPPWIFELLARLDGLTPWPQAVADAEAALGHPVPADLVAWLWWRGCLAEPEDDEGETIEVLPAGSRGGVASADPTGGPRSLASPRDPPIE